MSNSKKVSVVIPQLHLRSIYVRSLASELDDDFDPLLPNQQLAGMQMMLGGAATASAVTDDATGMIVARNLTFTHSFQFSYFLNPEEAMDEEAILGKKPVAKVAARISAAYSVPPDVDPTEDQLKVISESVSLAHVWPYWRELCHSNVAKMSLPGMVMPLLQIRQRGEDEESNKE